MFFTRALAESQETGEDPVMNRLDELGAHLEAVRADLSRLEQGQG